MSDLEGVILSDYLLLKCISKGGVADVYRARENGEGNFEVAVKVFRPGYAQREAFRDYFMAEAEKIGQFDHSNILPFLEFGEGEGLLYTVTPFVVPGTLEDLLVRVGGKFSAMQALPIMQQLCSAVQYAHSHDPQTPPPSANTTSPSSHTGFSFLATPSNDTSKQALTTMNFGSPGLPSSEGKSNPKMSFLQENTSIGQDKNRFWSVDPDPLEWSPITNTQVGTVPLTANAYLHSKPLAPTELPPEQQANDNQNENKLNEGLRKALPIVVVILLLLGLLGALLSSFYFPGDRHGAYSPPTHEHTAQFVVYSIKTWQVVPLALLKTTPEYVGIED